MQLKAILIVNFQLLVPPKAVYANNHWRYLTVGTICA